MDYVKLKQDLVRDEDSRALPYVDTVGKVSIGIGRNLTDRGLSPQEIDYLYTNDVQAAVGDLKRNFPTWEGLSDPRQRVLVNMCFNLGWPRLSGFKNMLWAIKCSDWERAATEMLDSKWAKQVGLRAARLAEMMRKG